MHPEIGFMFMTAAGLFLVTTGVATIAWLRARERAIRAELALRSRSGEEGNRRLQQTVEALGEELERIGEGQRFVTKVLAERDRGRVEPSPSEDPPRS